MSTHTIAIRREGKRLVAECPLKLWRIEGHDYCIVANEAVRYYMQYLEGGEYDGLKAGAVEMPANSSET